MEKPNLLLFVSDHFRCDALHHMGNKAAYTPNFDRIASEDAVSFKNAFCQNPVCVPSRCSFLSGRYPHIGGFRTMHHLHNSGDQNLLLELKKNGYHIYFGGKNDVFRKDVPLSDYCDYRSDAYQEMSCMESGRPLPEGYTRILTNFTVQQARDACRKKDEARREGGLSRYYTLYQGVVATDNPLEIGYIGAEDAQIADAINYIKDFHGDKPLCIYLSLILPHPQYAISKEEYDLIERESIPPVLRLTDEELSKKPAIMRAMRKNYRLFDWTDEQMLDLKQVYLAMIAHIDSNFGKVVNCLKAEKLYSNTAILAFSDHADYAGDFELAEINQNTFEDVLTNVPLIVKPPEAYTVVPRVSHALVELVDVTCTAAEFCKIQLPETHFGKSLVHCLDKEEQHKDFVFCEGGRLKEELHCTDGGHSEEHLYWARTHEQEKIPEHTKATMIRSDNYKYVYRVYEKHEFYDLKKDPQERQNLIDEPEYSEKIIEMQRELLGFLITTADVVPMQRDER